MSTQIDYARIVLLNRTSRELAAANPVLLAGEAAVADVGTKAPNLRFGDGVRPWTALPSFNAFSSGGDGGGVATVLQPPVAIPAGPDGSITLTVQGAPGNVASQVIGGRGNTAFEVMGAPQDAPGWYAATIHPLVGTTPRPGTSNGLNLAAGTNADDTVLLVQNAAGTKTFERIRGDGSGYLGPDVSNAMYWDAAGRFGVRGTATFPAPSMANISDVSFTNLQAGHVLEYNGTNWTNVLQSDGTVRQITLGPGLESPDNQPGGMINVQGTIQLKNTAVTPGAYTFASITVDAQGRITAAASGQVVTALASLTDVALDSPIPEDVLAFDGTHWANTKELHLTHLTIANDPINERDAATKEYVDGAIAAIPPPPPPEEGITQLVQLTDVSVSGVQDGQVISWDAAASRWRNRDAGGALALLSDVGLTTPTVGQLLTFNGTRWVNGGTAVVPGLTVNTPDNVQAMGFVDVGTYSSGYYVGFQKDAGTYRGFLGIGGILGGGSDDFTLSAGTAGLLRFAVNGQTAVTINQTRNVVVNAPSAGSGTTLSVYSNHGEATLVAGIVGASNNPRLFITSYEGPGQTDLNFTGSSGANGSISVGNVGVMTFGTQRNVTINAPATNNALTVWGASGNWAASLRNNATNPYGLLVGAGDSVGNVCFQCQNANLNTSYLLVRGDGSGAITPDGSNGLTWTASGQFALTGTARLGAVSKGNNGWEISPSGLLRQWGKVTFSAVDTAYYVAYPRAFMGNPYTVVVSLDSPYSGSNACYTTNVGSDGFYAWVRGVAGGSNVAWMAVGNAPGMT